MNNIFEPLFQIAANQTLEEVRIINNDDYIRLAELIDDLTNYPQFSRYAYELEDILNNLVGCAANRGVKVGFELCIELKKQL
jgi:hypothetical protein